MALLVAPMVSGTRELIAGLVRDPQFGPCVMLGIGGVLAEAIGDVGFRVVPVSEVDAENLVDDLRLQTLLGEFRGEPAVDRDVLVSVLTGLSRLAIDRPDVVAVDVNPLIVVDGRPVAVDALVEIEAVAPNADARDTPARPRRRGRAMTPGFAALFAPRGVVVAGASTHPGKFGFVALHNILAAGFPGPVGGDEPRSGARARDRHRARHRGAARPARGTSSSCARRPRPTPTSSAPPRSRASAPRS